MIEDKRLGLTLIVQSGVIIPLAAVDPCSAEPGPGKGGMELFRLNVILEALAASVTDRSNRRTKPNVVKYTISARSR
jgi:hypothetical protein